MRRQYALLLLGFALLASHEIDAALAAEWRLLLVLRDLADPTAATAFTLLHVPLFAALLWLLFHPRPRVQSGARSVFMAFLVVHAGLHAALSGHPLYGFSGWDSNLLIFGAGVTGLAYLVAEWRFIQPALFSRKSAAQSRRDECRGCSTGCRARRPDPTARPWRPPFSVRWSRSTSRWGRSPAGSAAG